MFLISLYTYLMKFLACAFIFIMPWRCLSTSAPVSTSVKTFICFAYQIDPFQISVLFAPATLNPTHPATFFSFTSGSVLRAWS